MSSRTKNRLIEHDKMNITNSTQEDPTICISNTEAFKYVEIACLVVFVGLGVVGNIFIIILAAKYTERKNLHFLIINMAVSDICVAVVYATGVSKIRLPSSAPESLANVFCKTVQFVKNFTELLTLITLFIISIERYRATKLVIGVHSCSSTKLLVLTWLLSMLLSCFNLVFSHATKKNQESRFSCDYPVTMIYEVSHLINCILLLLLYILVLILSVATSMRLSRNNPIQSHLSDDQRRRRERRTMSAVRMVLCSLLLYSICYLPDFFEDFIKSIITFSKSRAAFSYALGENCEKLVGFLIHILRVVNSALSPFVYLVFLNDFKRAAKKIISRQVKVSFRQQDRSVREDTRL